MTTIIHPPPLASSSFASWLPSHIATHRLTYCLGIILCRVRYTFLQDYRQDAREYLKVRAGKTDDEIDRYYVPRTFAERRQAADATKSDLHQTIALLQRQVDQLQWKVFGTNETEKLSNE